MCVCVCLLFIFCFFKQKTAYEMRISDWSSDVCSSDLIWNGRRITTRRSAPSFAGPERTEPPAAQQPQPQRRGPDQDGQQRQDTGNRPADETEDRKSVV